MLFWSIFILLFCLVAGDLSANNDNDEKASGNVCVKYIGAERLLYWLQQQCPVTYDDLCIDSELFDPTFEIKYRCQSSFEGFTNATESFISSVSLLTAAELLNMTKYKDPAHRYTCIVSLFYAPNCPFSARLTPAFNAVPLNFYPIKAVAVDATDFSRMNARYGIGGTPTLILWVNGIAVARMERQPLSSVGIQRFLENWTDLKSKKVANEQEDPVHISPEPSGDILYLLLSLLSVFLSGVYLLRNYILDFTAVQSFVSSHGGRAEDVKRFLNGM